MSWSPNSKMRLGKRGVQEVCNPGWVCARDTWGFKSPEGHMWPREARKTSIKEVGLELGPEGGRKDLKRAGVGML